MEPKPDPVITPQAATLDELDSMASRSLFAAIPAAERIAAIRDLHAVGATTRDAGQRLLQLAERAQPAPVSDTRPACETKDLPRFSLSRAALISAGKAHLDGIEGEVHQELSRRYPQRSPQGVCVPRELLAGQRNNLATVNSVGGYLTTLDNRTDLLVPYLYPASIVARLGVTNLTGLRNSFTLPVGTAGVTAEYVGEAAAASKSTPTLGQKSSTPKALSAYANRSMQLLEQGGPGVDTWLRTELLNGAATKLDEAFLTGAGGASPDGLFLLSGTNGVTFGGAAVWADVLEFLSDIENQKITISDNAKWLTNPTVRRKWQTIEQATGTARWLMDETPESRAAGYPTIASSAILTTGTYANRIAFGNWETVLFCEYFSPEIKITEDATLARTGMVQISLLQHNDFVFTRPEALTVSTDTAAA